MLHDTPLIATIVAGLVLACLLGLAAQRLRLPALAGYLLAGVLIGPFTPGYVADQHLASELAEIGVILLMFGVGLHFSLKDLSDVKAIAIPGAIGQILAATLVGATLGWGLGWGWGGGLIFGLALSVASTVVLLRALQDRRLIETERGRIAVGWLIVEDLVMVLALVLLPPLAGLLGGTAPMPAAVEGSALSGALGLSPLLATLLLTGFKVVSFVALMLIVGRRVIPRALQYVAGTGSRELFSLAVLAIALGVAFGSAHLFGVSLALGAFFAGMVMAESPLSSRAASDTLPLRDAFAVLFFVSVGMLFDPRALIEAPLALAATVAIIVGAKSLVAYGIVRSFGHDRQTALTIAASLAQIGEFSFILAVLGTSLGLLPTEGQDLILGGAMLSILVNPALFRGTDWLARRRQPELPEGAPVPEVPPADAAAELADHVVLVGYGRIGSQVAAALAREGGQVLVIDDQPERCAEARAAGHAALVGLAQDETLPARANIATARVLVLTIPSALEAGTLARRACEANPQIEILGRADAEGEVAHLYDSGVDHIVRGDIEVARGLAELVDSPGIRSAARGNAA
ncbi:YbaL family putative K(+) efflux transporter [Alloyangia pacifica]|uniref:YbaL family putative K(+) efflux transporter n=1 Tax=Alloyangia pacifica TaxID=311180 RepID=UPI001CFEA286|nr:YbaL family putative K(+) efflux transporter [Alloyangia pacifica]